ncbi:FUSC family protein [Streptomyces sp. NPDC007896]|uniref:FUSC family protein n=1 Tax=Streptomyces sp. NPDC007896 TaxID=3364784 RepID=UPI0036E78BF5
MSHHHRTKLTRVLSPRGALTLHAVDGALLFALRAALAMALPALQLVLSGRTALAVFPMLGAFTTTFGRNLPYRRRARVLAVAAVAMTMCVGLGAALAALTDPRAGGFGTAVVIAAMAVTAGLAKFLCDATRLSGLGAVLMLFSFAVAANGPADGLTDVLAQTGLAATGAATAWVLALLGWVVHPDRPQRLAVAVALRELAGLLEPDEGADGTGHTRHRATAAVLWAYQSLGLSPLTTGQRRGERSGTCVFLTDLAWSVLIASACRQTPDAPTARYLRVQARHLTVRYRRLPSPPPHPMSPSVLSSDTATGHPDEAGPAARRAAELTVGTGAGSPGHVAVLVVPAFRMALGTGLAGGLAAFLSFGHGYWAALSAAAVLHSVNVRSTLQRALQRALGTAAGLLIAFGVLATHPAPTALVALIVVFEFLLEYTVARNYGLGVVFLTPLALLMSDLASPAPVGTLVHDRTLGSVLGILIGLACALLVVHGRPAARVERALAACGEASERAEQALADSAAVPHSAVQTQLAVAVVELREADDAAAGELYAADVDPARLAAAEQRAYVLLEHLHRTVGRHAPLPRPFRTRAMNPAHSTGADGTTLYYGDLDAPHVLEVFVELRDRASHRMADSLLGTIRRAADDGKFVAKFHFAGTIDDTVGGSGSQRGLSALAAASDAGQRKFVDYLAALFASQPFPPVDDQFSDVSVLLSLADKVNGLRNAEFDMKVTDGTYLTWAGEVIGNFASFGVVGTPVVRYDDEVIPVVKPEGGPALTPQEFLDRLRPSR